MMSKNVAIMGATGAVGAELLKLLEERDFPVGELRLLASARSAGKTMTFRGETITIQELTHDSFEGIDIVLASAGGSLSAEYAPSAVKAGAVVVDNTSHFRLDPEVPLVVPEINADAIKTHKGIIANPNCTTAIAAVALWPLHKAFGIKKTIISTYQAASGAGAAGMDELKKGVAEVLEGKEHKNEAFAHPLPFNVIPHIDKFQDNGYTKEEMKVTWETRKIFGEADMPISCSAVRIPTLRAHSEAIVIETEKPISPDAAREVLAAAPGVEVVDDPAKLEYPMPLNATAKWDVEVGRIRQNLVFGENGLEFFVCGDQLLKGAALNAIQIAEALV
jgi:aspartate-semialdehyde dehydrogenase